MLVTAILVPATLEVRQMTAYNMTSPNRWGSTGGGNSLFPAPGMGGINMANDFSQNQVANLPPVWNRGLGLFGNIANRRLAQGLDTPLFNRARRRNMAGQNTPLFPNINQVGQPQQQQAGTTNPYGLSYTPGSGNAGGGRTNKAMAEQPLSGQAQTVAQGWSNPAAMQYMIDSYRRQGQENPTGDTSVSADPGSQAYRMMLNSLNQAGGQGSGNNFMGTFLQMLMGMGGQGGYAY